MLRFFRPGSAPWLLAHEVRLGWRDLGRGFRRRGASKPSGQRVLGVVAGVIVWGFVAMSGIALGVVASRFALPLDAETAVIVDAVTFVLLTLMLSQTISLSVQALFERQDLDLLFSSPIRPRVVLSIRAMGIMLTASILYVGLVTPFIVTASLLGRPEWLGLYVVLITMGQVATAIGILVTVGLFSLIGPRRTQTIAQILAGVVGGGVFLMSQYGNIYQGDRGGERGDALLRFGDRLVASGAFDPGSFLAWPVRALTGAGVPLVGIALLGAASFGLVVFVLGPRFGSMTVRAAGAAAPTTSLRAADRQFAGGLTQVMVHKELRLLARDPQLVSQVVLRLVYLAPIGIVLFRNAERGASVAFGGAAVVLVAGQLAGSFSWATVSAEDAPDLLACAPIDRSAADRAKLAAALVPTFLLTGLALVGLAALAPTVAALVLLGSIGAAVCSGFIQIWQQQPASRKAFNQRRRSSFLAGLVEVAVQMLWASATGLVVSGRTWGVALLPVAALFTVALRRSPARRHRIG